MSWNKGFTKFTHPSLMKTSNTMRSKGVDNFSNWRSKMRETGKIPKDYKPFSPSGDLAEFIGVVLGDGNISRFPRTERLILVSNANNSGFIEHYSKMTESLFNKIPNIYKMKDVHAVRISFYQKYISQRLGVPLGNRNKARLTVQKWINDKEDFIVRFLKGLFEAEGSFSIHIPTCTYNFSFSNRNESLLDIVEHELILLGYHPERRNNAVRLRKRHEALGFEKQIGFRKYPLI